MGWSSPAGGLYSSPRDISSFMMQLLAATTTPLYTPRPSSPSIASGSPASSPLSSPELASDFLSFGGYSDADMATGVSKFGYEVFAPSNPSPWSVVISLNIYISLSYLSFPVAFLLKTLYSCGFQVLTKAGLVPGYSAFFVLVPSLKVRRSVPAFCHNN